MGVLPSAAGAGVEGVFSLDRGVGIALAISFFLNVMLTRPRLGLSNKGLWLLIVYTLWVFFASLIGATFLKEEMIRSFTQFQLLILVLIVYWIISINGKKTLVWALRSYVMGSVGTIFLTYITGAGVSSMRETAQGRYTATLGGTVDANLLSAMLGIAVLTTIYLLLTDKNKLFRVVYLVSLLLIPLMMLKTGSRGGMVAVLFALFSPLLFVKQVAQKPSLLILLVFLFFAIAIAGAIFMANSQNQSETASRFTDINYARESLIYRMSLNVNALEIAFSRPTGSTVTGWFVITGLAHHPHNDFFYILGVYGFLGAFLFVSFLITQMFTVKRMPFGLEKIYVRSVLIFLIVIGLNIAQPYKKYFWIFMAVIMAAEKLNELYSADDSCEQDYYCGYEVESEH